MVIKNCFDENGLTLQVLIEGLLELKIRALTNNDEALI